MKVRNHWTKLLLSLTTVTIIVASTQPLLAEDKKELSKAEQGRAIAFDRKKGNCLACHVMGDGEMPGNIAPPLIVMKARYPDKAKLRAQVWDATVKNPNTAMPPFGRHQILSEKEIDAVVEYVYGL